MTTSGGASHLPWFALYVKSRHEKAVALSLSVRGFDCFLPTYLKLHRDSKKFELPLFPSYVFCRMEASKPLSVLTTPGVFSIVGTSHKPVPVPDNDIDGIRRMVEFGEALRPWPYVSAGQEICLKSGPLRGLRGMILDESHDKWLIISVDLLQRSIAAKIDRASISYEVSHQVSCRPALHVEVANLLSASADSPAEQRVQRLGGSIQIRSAT